MVGLLNRPEDVSPSPAFSSIPLTGPVVDEELLRWVAEAEYLGVSRETAILIATKRRALNLNKSGNNLVVDEQKCIPLASERPPSCSKDISQSPISAIRAEADVCVKQDSGVASLPGTDHESCSEGCDCEGHLDLGLQEEQPQKPISIGLKNSSSQTSSTQETITTKFDGPLDQVINTAIAHINLDESKRKKKKNKKKKKFSQKNIFNTSSHSDNISNVISSQCTNAQLLKTIVEKDSSSKMVLSDDNNSSVDTTMGVVNSGTNQVDRLTTYCSGLDAVVAAHSNNPFNNNGRNYNIKVKRKKRFYQKNCSNPSSSYNKQNTTQNTQVNSTLNDFPEPSRMNLKHTKRNFNRNRNSLGLNPNSISHKVTDNGNHTTLTNPELRNPTQQHKSNGGNGRRANNSERGRVRPRKSEAVEHVREQLRIAFRSRGVLEI
ncbi:uncharacterized protein cubi_03604 [Cryptosporidium ubiquitum]|uniref:Uncharacterized protein n=1 Tax=Cryptosporidium ubiquitum TaxID=857276 RepID=A0A1J4MIF8_9CRYT|nr:uncharacterized protein cubi_03604 [Cryptosporidium ubiquitum]OII73807.1 hypothetical protein cubi_03604 [Cryptosporidium ubiquitum]